MADEFTAKFRVDVSDLKNGIRDANKAIKLANAEFNAASKGMDNWQSSTAGIQAKLKQLTSVLQAQYSKLNAYESQLKRQKNAYKENGARADELRAKLKELADKGVDKASEEYQQYEKELAAVEKEQQNNGKAIDDLNVAILNQQGAINKTEKDIRNYNDSMALLEDAQAKAEAEAKKQIAAYESLDNAINAQESALDRLKREYVNVVLEQGENSASAQKLANNIEELSSELAENQSKMRNAEAAADKLDHSLDDLDESSGKLSGGFTVMKGALANLVADGIRAAVQAMKDFVAETINVGKEFDSAMSKVQAVSGATGKELDALRAKAKEMGATTQFTASEAAEALNYMAMAGWKTEEMLDGLEGVMHLAAASGEDLGTTSDIVTDALTAMGYAAKDAGKFADVMAAASSNANTNVGLMGSTFQYVAPVAGSLGYTIEDLGTAIGLMANSGIKGEKAGTALRAILSRLSAPPKKAADAMEELGISITNTDGSMKPLSQLVDELRQKFSKLTKEEKASFASALAGQNAMSGLLAIVNSSQSDFDKLTDAIQNSNGAAKEMANVMLDNLGGDLTKLKSKFEGVQISLYEKLTPALRGGTKILSGLTDALGFVVDHLTEFGTVILSTTAALTVFFTMINQQAIIALFTKGITTLTSTFATLNATMLANPYALLAAGIAALVVAFAVYASKIRASSQATLQNVTDTRALIDAQKELDDTIAKNTQTRSESIKFAGEEAQTAEILSGKLSSLMGIEKKSAKEKQKIKQVVSQLNSLMPELNLKYDEEKDKLNKSTAAIKKQIKATKQLAKAKAAEAALSEIAADMVKKEQERTKLSEQLTANEKAYAKAKKATADFVEKYGADQIAQNTVLQTQYSQLLQAEGKQKTAIDETKKALEDNAEAVKKLNEEYDRTGEYAIDLFDKAGIQEKVDELTKLCKKAGVEIPKSIKQGIDEGKYEVPSSVEELNQLIKFDNAVKKAEEQGYKIPDSLAEKIRSGKMTVDEAVKAIDNWINFNGAVQKAGLDGYEIPAKLKSAILSGKVDVDTAVKQMNNWIKFQGAIEAAGLEGYEIPKELQSSILSGKTLTDEAADKLIESIVSQLESGEAQMEGVGQDASAGFAKGLKDTDATNKNATELVTSAINAAKAAQASHSPSEVWRTQVGLSAGQGFAAGLSDSASLVSAAVAKLINGAFSNTGGVANTMMSVGLQAGQSLAKGISSATGAVVKAGNTLKNSLSKVFKVSFTKVGKQAGQTFASGISSAKAAASKAGTTLKNALSKAVNSNLAKIGKQAGQTFSNGITSAKSAVTKAGNTIKQALTKAAKTDISGLGKQAAQGFAKGVNAAVSAVKSAGSRLKSALSNAAKGGYSSMYSTGQHAAEGFRKGILSKAQSIASAAASVVKKAISAAKAAQESASPSKIWQNEIGAMAGEGYIVGIEKKIKPAAKMASKLVTSAIDSASKAAGDVGFSASQLASGVMGMSAGVNGNVAGSSNITSNSRSIVNNFNQVINAPKQPSRIELYRQTKNLLALAKEGGM